MARTSHHPTTIAIRAIPELVPRVVFLGLGVKETKTVLLGISATCLILPAVADAGNAEDYRFPREPETTKDGYPLPLTGVPITKTLVIAKTPGGAVKKYPEHYIPGKEILAKDEMRITACGSWGPAPMRIGQGAFWSDKPRRTCSPGPRRRQSLRKDWT